MDGMAGRSELRVVTLDLNKAVNSHVATLAAAGKCAQKACTDSCKVGGGGCFDCINTQCPTEFEQCRTAVQVIASEKSSLWPYAMNVRYFNRLGGPKELVTLKNTDQWVYTREFHEMYAQYVIRWFARHEMHTEAR